jgi:hypothetical protein
MTRLKFDPRCEQYKNILRRQEERMFFSFPEDARWNPDRQAVEFGIGVGEYEGVVRVPRQVFRRFIDGAITPERCLEAYHLQRTRFELVAERKLRNRQLSDDGNVEINGRDLRSLRDSAPLAGISGPVTNRRNPAFDC